MFLLTMKFMRQSIGGKLVVMLLCMVILPTLSLGILAYVTFKNETSKNTNAELSVIAHDWQMVTNTYIQQEQRVLRREQSLAETRLKTIALHMRSLINLNDSTQLDIADGTKELIDGVELGRSGYVFLLKPDGTYIWPLKSPSGKTKFSDAVDTNGRDISSEILQKSSELRNGQTYTAYFEWTEEGFTEPRKQLAVFSYSEQLDVIVGALSYYSDFQSNDLRWILQDELRTLMAEQKIKNNGYVWAINSKGDYLVSKNKLRDGENIADVQDDKGRLIIRNLIQGVTGAKEGEDFTAQFLWKNVGENQPSMQLTVATYVPEWDWIIGASAYEKDYLMALNNMRLYIALVSFMAIVGGSIASYFFSRYITRPLKLLQKAALQIKDGDLDHSIPISSHDEVGLLANDLEIMRQQLKNRNEKLEESNVTLQKMATDLTTKNDDVQKLNKFMINRELKMVELKKENEALKNTLKKNG